jgi:hypothetical protein
LLLYLAARRESASPCLRPVQITRRSDGNKEEGEEEGSWKEAHREEVVRKEVWQEDEARAERRIHEADDTERAARHSCRKLSSPSHRSDQETVGLHSP